MKEYVRKLGYALEEIADAEDHLIECSEESSFEDDKIYFKEKAEILSKMWTELFRYIQI